MGSWCPLAASLSSFEYGIVKRRAFLVTDRYTKHWFLIQCLRICWNNICFRAHSLFKRNAKLRVSGVNLVEYWELPSSGWTHPEDGNCNVWQQPVFNVGHTRKPKFNIELQPQKSKKCFNCSYVTRCIIAHSVPNYSFSIIGKVLLHIVCTWTR
jgi:hypothetical protein